jgi:hypothetical protein
VYAEEREGERHAPLAQRVINDIGAHEKSALATRASPTVSSTTARQRFVDAMQ